MWWTRRWAGAALCAALCVPDDLLAGRAVKLRSRLRRMSCIPLHCAAPSSPSHPRRHPALALPPWPLRCLGLTNRHCLNQPHYSLHNQPTCQPAHLFRA